MAEEFICNLGYDAQSDTKRQKLLKCVLTGNSKLYLGRVYTEDQLAKLNNEEVENFLIIAKLSYQADGKVIGALSHHYVLDGSLCSTRNEQSGCSERRS